MKTVREAIESEMRRRHAPRAKAAVPPRWDEKPLALAFFGAVVLMLTLNLLLNVFPS